MLNKACNAEPGSLPQTDAADLAESIGMLRDRIVAMVADGEDTRRQSERLFGMLRVLQDLKTARLSQPQAAVAAAASIQPQAPRSRHQPDAATAAAAARH